MTFIGKYIVSISATSLICGMIGNFMKDSCGARAMKMVCNLILMLAILLPVVTWCKKDIPDFVGFTFPESEQFVEEGARMSGNAAKDIIKQQTEAYIVDKAAAMGVTVTATVVLNDNDVPVPVYVEVSGKVSPYIKLRLEEMIQEDLNITKENQVWTG